MPYSPAHVNGTSPAARSSRDSIVAPHQTQDDVSLPHISKEETEGLNGVEEHEEGAITRTLSLFDNDDLVEDSDEE